jgi:hypothetical protein
MAKAVKAIGNAVSSVVKGVVNVVKSVVKAVVGVVSSVVSMIVQPFMGLMGGMPDIGDAQEAERQQGVLVQQQGGGAVSVPVVYGFRKLAGITTFAETGSTNNKYLWVVYTFCEGPVNGLREVYLNDESLPATMIASLNAGTQVNITEGKFKGRVSMLWSPGVYFSNPASSTLGTTLKSGLFKDAPSFASTMVHNGLACLFVRYEWLNITTQAEADANPFSGSIPTMQVVMQGRRIASLETSTSESYEYGASGYTERYSTNPAEVLLDYLRNPRYGKGLKNSEIDWASFRIAASKCNTIVTYAGSTVNGPIMTCNYVLDTGYSLFQNVKLLLQGFRAYLPYVQGKYKLKIEDAGNPTNILSGSATIVAKCTSDYRVRDGSDPVNQYDIMGDVTYTGIERSAKYNAVVVTYVEPSAKWATNQVVYPAEENGPNSRQTYITADGGRENKLEVTFSTITNQAMAWDMARLLFNKSRNQETASVKVSSQGFEIEPGDCILIQSQILNFADTPWRVINIAYNDDYTFDLSCVRNPDSLYPYVKVGEPDVVLPIYIPKGATIYYPVERDPLPIGLVPPATIPFTGGGTPLNPAPNNPNAGTDAGGVGGSGSPINSNGTNNTPPGAPKPVPLDDIVDVTNVSYTTKNSLIYARLTCKQPGHSMYSGVDIYYKLNSGSSGYQILQDTQTPGANASFIIDLGPLSIVASQTTTTYLAYFRVRYSTGELSTKFFNLTLTPATTGDAGNPSEFVQISANSWPSFVVSGGDARDNKVDIIRFVVPAPQPSGARTGIIQFSQDIKSQDINFNVTGMNVYAKSDAENYWTKTSYTFSTYSPGSEYAIPYTGSLGATGAGMSGTNVVPGGGAVYTFVFRLTYRDGKESTNQFVGQGKLQGWAASATGVALFSGAGNPGNVTDTSITKVGHMPSSSFAVTEPPADTVANVLNTETKMNATIIANNNGGINFGLLAPAAANRGTWQGMRFRFRAVVPGISTTFNTRDFKGAGVHNIVDSGTFTPYYSITDMAHDTTYEVVATPLVLNGSTEFVESNFSSYGQGRVSTNTTGQSLTGIGQFATPNWAPTWNWVQMDTGKATDSLNKTFAVAAQPIASVISCIGYREATLTSSTQYKIREYITLSWSAINIANFTSLKIYRRDFFKTPTGASTEARYYGIGRWEKLSVGNASTKSGTVNLRLPTKFNEFNPYYGVTPLPNGADTTLTRGWSPLLAGDAGVPRGLASDNSTNSDSRFCVPLSTSMLTVQLLLVAEVSGVESTKGLLIKGQILNGTGSVVFPATSRFEVEMQSATDVNAQWIRNSDFPLVGGINYRRKLSDARTTQVIRADMVVSDNDNANIIATQRTPPYLTLVDSYPPSTGTTV